MNKAFATVAIVLVAATTGCGTDQSRGGHVTGDTLTIYSSLPFRGPHARQSLSIVNAEKLALKEAGGKAGDYKINFASRDDATGHGGVPGWSAGHTADNAARAAEDARTIAYIGEFDSGATAISVPVTNEAGFAQVTPAAGAVGLTKLVTGADKGEPDKYYPSGDRNFVRVVPAEDVQGSAAARWAKQLGARNVFIVDDKSVEGQGLVAQFRAAADVIGLHVIERRGMDPRADDYVDFAGEVADKHPDLVYFGGGVESNAVRFWRDMHAAAPDARLMGGAGLMVPAFYRGLAPGEAARTYVVSATQDPSRLPARGRRFLRDYRREFRSSPDAYAAYGHAAMSLLLDAIRREGESANHRQNIIDRVFDTRRFDSAIGAFSIDDNGDTDLDRVAGYRVRAGRLVFTRALRGQARG